MKHGSLELPWPAVSVGAYCVLEALFLRHVSSGASTLAGLPFAFESFWFASFGPTSLQMLLMSGNSLLAVLLWICWRLGPRRWDRTVTSDAIYVASAALLGLCQWGCRELSMAVPKLALELVP